jgi:hypothetical protein
LTYVVIFIERQLSGHWRIDQRTRLESPGSSDVAHSVTTSSDNEGWPIEALDKLDTVGVSVHAQVKATQTVTRQTVTAALKNNGIGVIVFHDIRYDGLEDGLVGGVVNAVSEREVDCVVLALANTNVSQFAGAGEVFSVLVERNSHDSVGSVEGLLDTISVVDVDVDVEDSLVES